MNLTAYYRHEAALANLKYLLTEEQYDEGLSSILAATAAFDQLEEDFTRLMQTVRSGSQVELEDLMRELEDAYPHAR